MCVLKIAFSTLGVKHLIENQNISGLKENKNIYVVSPKIDFLTLRHSKFRDDRYPTVELDLETVSVSF